MKNLCTRCLVKARLGGWDGAMVSYQRSIYPSSAGWSWLSWRCLGGGWRNREEKLCAGHDAAAAVQRSRENNIQTEYFCLSPFCLQDPLSLEFGNFDIDILAFTPLVIRWGVCPEIHNKLSLVETICVPCSSSCGEFKHLFVCKADL